MENINYGIYFDKRRRNANGKYNIYFKLYRDKKNVYVSSRMDCYPEEFDGKYFVGKGSWIREQNEKLQALYRRFTEWCDCFDDEGMDNKQVKEMCDRYLFDKTKKVLARSLSSLMKQFLTNRVLEKSSVKTYTPIINKLIAYGDVELASVNVGWMRSYDKWLETASARNGAMKKNSRFNHLKFINTVMNYAVELELLPANPISRYKITREETRMRFLTREQIIQLRDIPLENEHQRKARDLWMLSFYLLGINNKDLFNMKKLEGGRCVYRRAKTKKIYDVAVPPEAMEIIERYRGKKFLLDVNDKAKDGEMVNFASGINQHLKNIGKNMSRTPYGVKKDRGESLFPDLSMYWARYSAATLMAELDIPMETISQCLGHSTGVAITRVYVQFNRKKIDEAQRKMIDALK